MATGSIVLNVMDVGQGQGTFVEVYNKADKLTNTLLFDLGSAKGTTTAGLPSIDYIVDQIKDMATPKIDYLSLSHKDRDHVNLLVKLITAINLKIAPKKLQIGHVRYGGAKDWYSSNLIGELEKLCPDVKSLNLRHTCYVKKTPPVWEPVWLENDVYVYIILANIPSDTTLTDWSQLNVKNKPDSELANSVSIISSVWWNGNQFFINGDATFVTMQESNKIYELVPNFNNPQMVTLPHHGSRKTTFGLSTSTEDASTEATKVVKTFAKKISARTITSSAEIFGSYHHPSYDVMVAFNEFADKKPWIHDKNLAGNDRHYVTAYLDNKMTDKKGSKLSNTYSSFETKMNVYSTLYCVPGYIGAYLAPPTNPVDDGTKFPAPKPYFPLGVQWGYTVDSAGKVTLALKTNRAATLLNIAETMEALGPPGKWVKDTSPSGGVRAKAAASAKSSVLRGLKSFR